MRLKDKVAIVTGGAHGMGEAEARLFAQEGAAVVIADLLNKEGEAVAADIGVSQGHPRCGRTDVTSETDWQNLIADRATFGRLDILVNNAGISGSAVGVRTTNWKAGGSCSTSTPPASSSAPGSPRRRW